MPGKTQTTATQSCKWKHIKKQLKKFSPADPRQEGKACFWQENTQAVPKNTYPSVDLITLQVTHRLLENLPVQTHPPIPESLLSCSAEESQAFLLTQIYLTQKFQDQDKNEYWLFLATAGEKS